MVQHLRRRPLQQNRYLADSEHMDHCMWESTAESTMAAGWWLITPSARAAQAATATASDGLIDSSMCILSVRDGRDFCTSGMAYDLSDAGENTVTFARKVASERVAERSAASLNGGARAGANAGRRRVTSEVFRLAWREFCR